MELIVKAINDATTAFVESKNLQANVHNIAEPIIIDEVGGVEQVRPAVVDESGEVDSNLFNDRYPVGFYHKLLGKQFVGATNKGYGDNIAYTEESNMSMIVFGVRSMIYANELEENIVRSIQELRYRKSATTAYCVVQNISYDRRQIFSSEYTGVPFFLQPNIFLFRINYKIITAHKSCN